MRIIIDGEGEPRQTIIGDCTISDTKFIQYPSGKYFVRYLYDDLLTMLAADMHRNIAADFDNVIVVQGGEGSGKSNFCYDLAKAFAPDTFDVTDCYVYDMDSLKDRFRRGDYGCGVFWLDETSNLANNRDWQSQSNKDIVSILETMRSRHMTFIMAIPHLERLDLYIRSFRMRYLVTCAPMSFAKSGKKERGFFELKKRNSIGAMELVGYGTYDKIPDTDKDRYEKLKLDFQDKKIKDLIAPDEGKGSKYKKMYESERKNQQKLLLRLHQEGRSAAELMDLFGIENRSTYDNLLARAKRAILDDS